VEHNQVKGELNTMRLSLIDSNLINANEKNMKLNIFENRIKHIRTKSALVNNNTQVFVMNDLKNLNINIGQINENNELKLPIETQHEQHQVYYTKYPFISIIINNFFFFFKLKSSITVQMSESEILNNVKIESMSETMDESSMLKRTTPTKFEDTQVNN
jgi:hypothetical protein